MRLKDKEIESLTHNLNDTNNQIKDINSLEGSYAAQLKSLETLKQGTSKLIEAEENKIKEMNDQENEYTENISK